MKSAAIRAEFANSVSADVAASDKAPEMSNGTSTSRGNLTSSGRDLESRRRASKIPTAGINGSTDRALIVQFRNAAKMKVPKIQQPSKRYSASRRFHKAETASARIEMPPAMKMIN